MNRKQKDLVKACKRNGRIHWTDVRGYAYNFKKYDDLTFRQIDAVVKELN